ncbi:myb-like protein D [Daktulosphaira vitifoliae]|uniref:myb-like protein D n=1 Tax=Daktulosphaira vitifoliae TaxID=58002 RepID=UPI0021AA5F83|nr:myb-like protein D [Daktulosphaira vitifoliae]
MSSTNKLKEQLSTRLKKPSGKIPNESSEPSTHTYIRSHQRNFSLPINNVFKSTSISNNESIDFTSTSSLHDNNCAILKNKLNSNDFDDDLSSNSDTGSTGTYIIERNSVNDNSKSDTMPHFDTDNEEFKKSNSMVKKLRSSWVNEWHSKLNQNKINTSSELNVPKSDIKPPKSPKSNRFSRKSNIPLLNSSSLKDLSDKSVKNASSDDDTRSILRDAENCMNMMEAKVDKANNYKSIQSNRTFNLRRDRFSKPSEDSKKKQDLKTGNDKSCLSKTSQNLSSSMSRVDCGRFSLRTTKAVQPNSSPLLSTRKNLSTKKKWNSSILSNKNVPLNKETELENWKRRKNYDPMKAAAEGKKKELQKATFSKGAISSYNTGNPVLRSASFHGRDMFLQDDEDDDDSDLWDQNSLNHYEPVGDWHMFPQPPATSRDHSPSQRKNENMLSSSANASLATLPTRILEKNGSFSTFYSSTSSSLDVSSMHDALYDSKDTSNLVQLSYKAKKRGIELMKRIRNELPEYDDEELERGIKNIDLNEDLYRVPMDSWEMCVTATNVNCVNKIFQILEEVLFKDVGCRDNELDN